MILLFKTMGLNFSADRRGDFFIKNPTLKEGPWIYLETRISYFILEEHPINALTITLQDLSNQSEHSSNRIAS